MLTLLQTEKGRTMADLAKLVNELSNLTVAESAELAKVLKETWGTIEAGQADEVSAAQKPTEGADIRLMQELIFRPSNVVLLPFNKEEKAKGKTPDFKLMKDFKLCGYCELKSPRDDWVFESLDEARAGESISKTRPSPTSNNLARQIESAVEQFDFCQPRPQAAERAGYREPCSQEDQIGPTHNGDRHSGARWTSALHAETR